MRRSNRTQLGTMQVTEKDKLRFWSKVQKSTTAECWPWLACVVKAYGQFTFRGKAYNRVMWLLYYGADAGSLLVCHTCDNPLCVNPHHLFLSTNQGNQEDAAIKGRKRSKLTPELVRIVRQTCVPNSKEFGYSALARKYACNPGAIWQAVNKTRWKHVT